VPAGTTLVTSGSFSGPEIVLSTTTNTLQFTGAGTDTKNTTFAGFYGLANPFTFVTTELSMGGATITPATGAFTAAVTDADFQNTALLQQIVSVPPSGLLVGLGLLLMGSAPALRRFV
jgi:hypothetical protein